MSMFFLANTRHRFNVKIHSIMIVFILHVNCRYRWRCILYTQKTPKIGSCLQEFGKKNTNIKHNHNNVNIHHSGRTRDYFYTRLIWHISIIPNSIKYYVMLVVCQQTFNFFLQTIPWRFMIKHITLEALNQHVIQCLSPYQFLSLFSIFYIIK